MTSVRIAHRLVPTRRMRRVGLALVGALVCWFAGTMASVALYASHAARGSGVETGDAAIVLGAAVWRDRPSPVFAERIRHGIDLYEQGRVRRIVFTGGVGQAGEEAESEIARQVALARSVPDGAVLCEAESHTTYGNLREAQRVAEGEASGGELPASDPLGARGSLAGASAPGDPRRRLGGALGRVLIVSDPLHMRRAMTMAHDLGLEARPSPTPTTRYVGCWSKAAFLARETYYYNTYLLRRAVGAKSK